MVIDLPETYSNTVYAGTKVVFELTVQTVSQPNVPMLTNAYVKETFDMIQSKNIELLLKIH